LPWLSTGDETDSMCLQAFLAVQAIDPFEIDAVAFAAEQDMQPAILKAPPFGGQDPQALAQGKIGGPPGQR
jgi:hypothetical protein